MIYCLLAKLCASLFGGWVCFYNPTLSLYWQAFLIGVLPIWAEVFASGAKKYEPARETNKKLLLLDACADAWVFLFMPCFWMIYFLLVSKIIQASLVIFLFCGILRLRRFVKVGLNSLGYFQGLPVTYTGYLWIVLVFLQKIHCTAVIILLLLLVSWAMISKKNFIKANR